MSFEVFLLEAIESVLMHALSELSTERAAQTGIGKKAASPEPAAPGLTLV
jgi:hypothetical protein